MNSKEFVPVPAPAVSWLKEHYPDLCVKAGLCNRVAGRLYTLTTVEQPSAIPASIRPRPDQEVSVYSTDPRKWFQARYNAQNDSYECEGGWFEHDEISHWIPRNSYD